MSNDKQPVDRADNPVDEFSDCHLDIVRQLEQLGELPALADAAARARRQASALLAFFEHAIEGHHGDEERELFPTVLRIAQPGDEAGQASQLVDRLTQEHRSLEKQWAALRGPIKRVARGADATLDAAGVARLVSEYKAHAALEERDFLPLAKSILQRESDELSALGLSLHIRHRKPPKPGYV